MKREISLYIHIPFCRRRCNYCSFVSYGGRAEDIPAYVDSLKQELAFRAGGEHVRSIYFGGGTPSLLPEEQIDDILCTIRLLFTVNVDAEITIEANPGTVDARYLADIGASGVNRLSIGVQSFNDRELALLGRIHTAAEAKEAIRLARDTGFSNLNIDLIYSLPGQNIAGWQHTLEQAVELKPEHISLYALTLEEEAPLFQAIERGALPQTDPDLAADMYETAEQMLGKYGYSHYEISNWSKPGYECSHNLAYWHNLPYIGAGVAAHSCMDGHRFANTSDLDVYLNSFSYNKLPLHELDEAIGPELHLSETVILGLRLSEGIATDAIKSHFGIDILKRYGSEISELSDLGLVECINRRIRLTPRGRLLGNEVFRRFLP
ncbi:MAG: radical SAM family heme chaperone HemW [Chloroflexi bacterium]|nr:radical SAM family heme chaperone HemW [Chloroflexota bacterium]